MTRKQLPIAGWQGRKPPGNGVRRPNLPNLIMLLAVVILLLAITAPIQASGPREADGRTIDQHPNGSITLFPAMTGIFADTSWRSADHQVASADDTAPQVTRVSMLSSPAVGDTYGLNELIKIGMTFETEVTVNGRPTLGIWIGSRWYAARYESGSGSDCLIFVHRVKWEDEDSDGISVPGGYVDENGDYHGFGAGGSIVDAATGISVNRLFSGLSNDEGHKVDWRNTVKITDVAIVSKPNEGDTYREGETLEVQLTYEEDMVVQGEVGVSIYVGDVDGSWRGARYDRGAGTDKLVFSYTVKRTDVDENGFSVSSGSQNSGYFGGGYVRSAATGQYSSRGYRALLDQSDHKVQGSADLVAPTISELKVVTTPTDRDYVAGEEIRVDVVFDEDVEVNGSAELELDFDGTPRTAVLVQSALLVSSIGGPAGGGDTLSFIYEVVEGDHDPDGFAIGRNKLKLTSGTIRDAAGNDAILDHDPLPASAVQCVDGRNHPPTFDEGASATRTVDEELESGSPVGDPLAVTDPEDGALTFSLSGEHAQRFAIDDHGQITNLWRLNHEGVNTFNLLVTVSDGVLTATLELTIQLTDIDEPGRMRLEWPPPVCTPVVHAYVFDPDRDETDHVWTWEISDNGVDGWTTIGLIESWDSTYSPTQAQANKFLRITVTYSDKFGSSKTVQRIEAIGSVEPLQNGCRAQAAGSLISGNSR